MAVVPLASVFCSQDSSPKPTCTSSSLSSWPCWPSPLLSTWATEATTAAATTAPATTARVTPPPTATPPTTCAAEGYTTWRLLSSPLLPLLMLACCILQIQ